MGGEGGGFRGEEGTPEGEAGEVIYYRGILAMPVARYISSPPVSVLRAEAEIRHLCIQLIKAMHLILGAIGRDSYVHRKGENLN